MPEVIGDAGRTDADLGAGRGVKRGIGRGVEPGAGRGAGRGVDDVVSALGTASQAEAYYANGWWRAETFVDDLRRVASAAPGRTVFVNWRRDLGREVVVTYGELADEVGRLSRGLRGLGLEHGDAVGFQLPNWWEAAALVLACMDAGLVAVPMLMTLGGREVERILAGTRARVCVVVDEWEGRRHDRMLAGLDVRLPDLEHRVVIGDAAATGALGVAELVAAGAPPLEPATAGAPGVRPAELAAGVPGARARGADEVSIVLFTSGTTGEMKGVLHTPNTQYASTWQKRPSTMCDSRLAATTNLIHGAGLQTNVLRPLVGGCASVFADTRDPRVWLDLFARHRVTSFLTNPHMLQALVRAQEDGFRALPELRSIFCTGAPLPPSLARPVRELLCGGLRNTFGMTETGAITATARDDPPDLAGRSIGRPCPGREIRLVPDGPSASDDAFRLHVRGPSVCLGTFRLRDRRPTWDPGSSGGWYDTGDLVGADGDGGLRYLSRVADRIGSPHPIPVLDVEDELLRHPGVAEAALIGCPDPDDGSETVCAFVVPDGPAPTLADLRRHLLGTGMTEWFLPTRLVHVDALPRNDMGKVRKNRLRDRLLREAE